MPYPLPKRPIIILLVLLSIAILAAVLLGSPPIGSAHHASILINDHDLSDSVLGWLIGIPVIIGVGALLIAIFAGIGALIMTLFVVMAGVVLFALLLAFMPLLLILAIPGLILYGLYKLVSPKT